MEPTATIKVDKPDQQTATGFRQKLTGDLLQPGDQGYDEARKVWNGMIDRHPALIARCKNTDDVIQSVLFARRENLLLSGYRSSTHACEPAIPHHHPA